MKMEIIEIEQSLFPDVVVDKCFIGGRLVFHPLPELLTIMRMQGVATIPDIMGPRRHRPIADIRFALWWVLHRQYGWSFPRIGREFNRDHSSVVHGVQFVDEMLAATATTERVRNIRFWVELLGKKEIEPEFEIMARAA